MDRRGADLVLTKVFVAVDPEFPCRAFRPVRVGLLPIPQFLHLKIFLALLVLTHELVGPKYLVIGEK